MAEKRLEIVIDPTRATGGVRIVKRQIQDIGDEAGKTQSRVEGMSKGAGQSFKEFGRQAEKSRMELDRLRAKFNPAYAAIFKYRREQQQLIQALKLGAISEDERAAAMSRSRKETLSSLSLLKGRNKMLLASNGAVKLNNMQLQNMSYQMNDIGVMMASGQSPFVMLMQQGMQIAQIFGPGTGVLGAMRAVGTGLTSFLLNPINLAVLGFASLAGAASWAYQKMAGSDAKDVSKLLESQSDWVSKLENGYDNAAKAARKFREESEKMAPGIAIGRGKLEKRELVSRRNALIEEMRAMQNWGGAMSQNPIFNGAAGESLKLVLSQFSKAKPDVKSIQKDLLGMKLGLANLSPTTGYFIDKVIEATEKIDDLNTRIGETGAGVREIGRSFTGPIINIERVTDSLDTLRGLTIDNRTEQQRLSDALTSGMTGLGAGRTESEIQRLRAAYDAANASIKERNRLEAVEGANRKARSAALKQERKAITDLAKAERDRLRLKEQYTRNSEYITDMQAEVEILAQSGAQRESNLIILKNERAVRSAIARLGKGAAQDQINLTEQVTRSRIAGLAGYKAEKAAMDEYKNSFKSFVSDFRQGLQSGEGGWKSFANAGLSALDKIATKLTDMAIDNLFDNAFGGKTGSSGGGGFLSSIFGSVFGGGKQLATSGPGLANATFAANAGIGGLFQSGGHTGGAATNVVAGLVHGQEFVAHAAATRQYRPELEAMNRGTFSPRMVQPPANNNSAQRINVHVTVSGELVEKDGNLVGLIGEVANYAVSQATPGIVDQSVNMVGKQRRAGGE